MQANGETVEGFVETRKQFKGLGGTVIVLGLISLFFLEHAAEGLAMATLAAIGLCVGAGVWLMSKPSVGAGVVSGVALLILGVCDLALAGDAVGLGLLAPAIDVGFAIKVFAATGAYARTAGLPENRQAGSLVKRLGA